MKYQNRIALFIFILYLGNIHVSNSLVVTDPPNLAGYYPSPSVRRFGFEKFGSLNGSVVLFVPNIGLRYDGLIVFIPHEGALPGHGIESKARKAKELGAVGIVAMGNVPSPYPGFVDIVWNECCPHDVQLPVVEITISLSIEWLNYLSSPNTSIEVIINDSDPNTPRDLAVDGPYHIYMGALHEVVAGVLTIFIGYKLKRYISYRGISPTVGLVFLIIELLCNFERFMFYLIDPMFTRQIFPHIATSILSTITLPFSLISALLISLTWLSSIKATKVKKTKRFFLQNYRIPFITITTILISFEVIVSVLRGLNYDVGTMILIIWCIDGVVGFIISIFYFVVGYMVLREVKSRPTRKITKSLMYSGVFQCFQGICLIIFAVMAFEVNPTVWVISTNAWVICAYVVSYLQVRAISSKPIGEIKVNASTVMEVKKVSQLEETTTT